MDLIYQNSIKQYQSSKYLDCLRGLAAIEVLLSHLRNLFFVDYQEVSTKNFLIKLLYFFTGFGHQAVIIFFVLSGFFISSSILKARRDNRWSWSWYLLNRLSRLHVVLIPALAIGWIWDNLGINLFGQNSIYGGEIAGSNIINFAVSARLGLLTFIGNLFFLQGIAVPTFGSNSPLWSLSNEFWYYILFPLLLGVVVSKKKFRSIYVFLTLIILFAIGRETSLYFLIWLLGAAIGLLPYFRVISSQKMLDFASFISIFVLAICLTAIKLEVIKSVILEDFLLGITSTVFIYITLNNRRELQPNLYTNFSQKLASFSYTLYLVHLPVLVFIQAALIHQQRWQPNIIYLLLGYFIFVIILLYAYVISRLTEAKTDEIRSAIGSYLKPKFIGRRSL
jgi:peptidoglycan/LPS O-acetylase OafA/YrhL